MTGACRARGKLNPGQVRLQGGGIAPAAGFPPQSARARGYPGISALRFGVKGALRAVLGRREMEGRGGAISRAAAPRRQAIAHTLAAVILLRWTRGREKPALGSLKGQAVLVSGWSGNRLKPKRRDKRPLIGCFRLRPSLGGPVGTLRILIQAQGQRLAKARLGVEGCEAERPMEARKAWLKGLQQGQGAIPLKEPRPPAGTSGSGVWKRPKNRREKDRARRHARKQPTPCWPRHRLREERPAVTSLVCKTAASRKETFFFKKKGNSRRRLSSRKLFWQRLCSGEPLRIFRCIFPPARVYEGFPNTVQLGVLPWLLLSLVDF